MDALRHSNSLEYMASGKKSYVKQFQGVAGPGNMGCNSSSWNGAVWMELMDCLQARILSVTVVEDLQ